MSGWLGRKADVDAGDEGLNREEQPSRASLAAAQVTEAEVIEEVAGPDSATLHLIDLVGRAVSQWKEDMGMQHVPDRLVLSQAIQILQDFEGLADGRG